MTDTVVRGRGTAAAALVHAEGAQFLRFCCVGAAGFCVNAAVLMTLVHRLGLDPILAWPLAALAGILTTFELNRRWAFRGAGAERYGTALVTYGGVQGLGLACNFIVYAGCYVLLPPPLNAPLLCIVAASAAALAVNYAGASRVVFRAAAR